MRILYAAPLVVLLAGCGATPPTPQQVADAIKTVCGIVVQVADIGTLITAGTNPLVNTADGWAHVVCDAYKTQVAAAEKGVATGDHAGTVTVNGVVVHYRVP